MEALSMREARDLVLTETANAFEGLATRGYRSHPERGHYPRVHVRRDDPWPASINFWLTLDDSGAYRTNWTRSLHFELGGAAAVDREVEAERIRYWKKHVLYLNRPYELALSTLALDLVALADEMEGWTEDLIVATGERVPIRRI